MKVNNQPPQVRALEHVEHVEHAPGGKATSTVDPVPEAPLPSNAGFAHGPPAAGGTPAWAAYLASKTRADAGLVAVGKRLDEIERLTAAGVRVRCVFDLDNTLFDTRWRTLACARSFDRQQGSGHFSALSDEQLLAVIARTGQETAAALGLPDDVVARFGAYWDEAFWRPENLIHDRPMDPPLNLVAEAIARGAEVVFLSGRVERHVCANGEQIGFREASLLQLVAAGVDVSDAQLILKPDTATKTAPFKAEVLRGFDQQGEIGFFLTEGLRDVTHVREALPGTECFLLACTFEAGARPIDVPVLPGRF